MTAGIVHFCGAWGGHTCGSTQWNKKGQFENLQIRELIIKPYLRSMGVDPLGQDPLPDVNNLMPCPDLARRIEFILKTQDYHGQRWFFKGAKMCLIWPVFHAAFPDAKWLIVRRDDEDIVNSCLRTRFMHKREGIDGWSAWVDEHKKRFAEMLDSEMQAREVWPKKFLENDFAEMRSAIDWLGLEWNENRVRDFIDPKLFHKGAKSWQESHNLK